MGSRIRLLFSLVLMLISRYRKKENLVEFYCLLVIGILVVLLNWPEETLWVRKALLDFITLIAGG